jgi:predicted nucleic acid-binding Zn finger protein
MDTRYQGTDHAKSGEMREDCRQAQVRWCVVVGPTDGPVMEDGFGTCSGDLLTKAARKP